MPRAAAARAAASPAGPAPITTRLGSVIVARSLLRADRVARPQGHQTSPLVRAVVDGHKAVEADPDAAEDPARAALAAGGAPRGDACRPQRGGDGLAGQGLDLPPVEGDGEGGTGLGAHQLQRVHEASSELESDAEAEAEAGKRSGRNGARSRSGACPVSTWAINCPVPVDSPMPAPSCPQAWNSPGTRGSGPIAGR